MWALPHRNVDQKCRLEPHYKKSYIYMYLIKSFEYTSFQVMPKAYMANRRTFLGQPSERELDDTKRITCTKMVS